MDTLLRERQSLLDKKFAGSMTARERNRLEYVRWSLDRIDDAKNGAALDMLEQHVVRYEQFLEDLAALREYLERQSVTKKKKQ